jgi:RNA polymerase-interacting CarD/CdnL/TRCF family regulator
MVPPMMRQMKFMPFARILVQLKLDSAQKAGIRDLMAAHQDCMHSAMEALRLAEKEVLDNARDQRQAIMADLKAGTITRTEAMTKLRDLNKATREALAGMPEREEAATAVQKCTDDLFAGIRALLNEDQQKTWDKWVETLGDINNCGRGKGMGMGGRKH